MEADPIYSGKPEALNNIYLPGGDCLVHHGHQRQRAGQQCGQGQRGQHDGHLQVPLSTVATWANTSPRPASAIPMANLRPRSRSTCPRPSLGQAAQTIATTQASLALPATVHGDFGGTAKVFQQSTGSMPLLIVAAIVTIYIVLGILYESAIHPLTVLSTLPSAGVGAILP
jgi:multidrug efflux pump